MSSDAATQSNKTIGIAKCEENENRTEDTVSKIQQDEDTKPFPEPNGPEKSTSPDTSENGGSSVKIQSTDKHPRSDERSFSPDGSELSNSPHTHKTHEQETTSTEDG